MMKCPELHPQALKNIDRLGRFWSFPRKKLADDIRAYLDTFQRDTHALHEQFSLVDASSVKQLADLVHLGTHSKQQQVQINNLDKQLAQQNDCIAELTKCYEDEQIKKNEARTQHIQTQAQNSQLQARQVEDAERIGQLETLVSKQSGELQEKHQNIAQLQEATEQLKSFHDGLKDNFNKIQNLHMTLQEKFSLVQSILVLEAPRNAGLETFNQLLHHEYLNFASREFSLADEAGALIELQAIHKELELIVAFPGIYNRTQVAVAGGFSSGKSQFINSFIHTKDIRLAVGMNPVTVVPSYVICAEQPAIRGYSANRGSLNLGQELYSSLSHEYVESLGFDLRKIMPFITVEVCMEENLFEHLCLIDTPGYNPGGGQAMEIDYNVAQKYAKQASAMIWVIGLDPAGTITQSDLDFIAKTKLTGEYLYILLNKADIKSNEAIENIICQVNFDLSNYGLEAAGISAYSSRQKKTYQSHGQLLEDFLHTHNHKYDALGRIEKKINNVFDLYQQAIDQDLSTRKKRRKLFEHFKIEALQHGGTDLYRVINELSTPIEVEFDSTDLTELNQECESLRKRFKEAAHAALDEASC